jgi:endogenous inhibitor of DNA gyrase (YacG/DUF329 family)
MQGRGAECPICRETARPREQNVAFPFCSPRCKLADLQRWLTGSYRVPGEAVTGPAEGVPEDGS